MRLDRYLAEAAALTRTESAKAIRGGAVTLDGAVVKKPDLHVDPATARVTLRGQAVTWHEFVYVMLNKPAGTISTTDPDPRSVMKLLPPDLTRHGMFPCGRLDVDTVGLLLLTDDGKLAHELLSPRHHAEKTYRFQCDVALTAEDKARLEAGIPMDGALTKPAKLVLDEGGKSGEITLTEGKFHQIKRMFFAVGSSITFLERIRFGTLVLDETLPRGACRRLTAEEEAALQALGAAQ